MDTLSRILEDYPDSSFVKADGFDDCIVGVDGREERLVYDVSKVIEKLAKDMPYNEAVEYFYFNIECAYVGEQTPIWMDSYGIDSSQE